MSKLKEHQRDLGLQKWPKLENKKRSGHWDNRGIKVSCQKPESNVFTAIVLQRII